MMYKLLNELVLLVAEFEKQVNPPREDIHVFGQWLLSQNQVQSTEPEAEPEWIGKENGRTPDSVINTMLVHLYRYARLHAKLAIADSEFATPDELVYLLNLAAYGAMSKTALVRLNVHEKSAGIQILNRLISQELVEQIPGDADKRSKIITLTDKGREAMERSMGKFRKASADVTGNISEQEKMDLIRILTKMEAHHLQESKNLLK
jgi:DNA-binding MarR family transcriptional regulator